MNVQHPIRALHGHLATVAPDLDALPPAETTNVFERSHANGQLLASLHGLDGMVEGLSMMAWHVERSVQKGAGYAYDLEKLERIAARLAEIHLQVETATSLLTSKLAAA